jgi:5-methylcytosine-specific restriction endonuclease McrA
VYYFERLQDPRWKKRRDEIVARDGFTCVRCLLALRPLEVHHRWYTKPNPWDEPEYNLETLCDKCHDKEHADDNNIFTLRQFVHIAHAQGNWDDLWQFAHYVPNEA